MIFLYSCFLGVCNYPTGRFEFISEFESRKHLIEATVGSCSFPVFVCGPQLGFNHCRFWWLHVIFWILIPFFFLCVERGDILCQPQYFLHLLNTLLRIRDTLKKFLLGSLKEDDVSKSSLVFEILRREKYLWMLKTNYWKIFWFTSALKSLYLLVATCAHH